MFITNYIIMLMHNNRPFTQFSDRKISALKTTSDDVDVGS